MQTKTNDVWASSDNSTNISVFTDPASNVTNRYPKGRCSDSFAAQRSVGKEETMALNDAEARCRGAKTVHSSPFLDTVSFDSEEREELGSKEGKGNDRSSSQRESPFLFVYETAGQPACRDPQAEALAEFLNEIHDDAFDEALLELVHEAAALVEDRFAAETGDLTAQGRQIESLLSVHFAPLAAEISRALDSLQEQLS